MMTHNKLTRVPFTATPNYYLDTIKPHLTHTESNVCDVVIRLTVGWQKVSTRISNRTFVSKSGKSERAIITAKKQLLDMGLLVQLEPARGTRPALYKLDLEYKTRRDIKEPQHELQDTLPFLDDEDATKDTTLIPTSESAPDYIPNITNQESLPTDDETTHYTNISEDIDSIQDNTQDNTQVTEIVASEDTVVEDTVENIGVPPTPQQSPVKNHSSRGGANRVLATNYEEANTQASTEVYAPLPYSIISNSLNINKKQTIEKKNEKEKKNPKKAVAFVRFNFLSNFPETKAEDDWKFFGWAVKEYDLEACMYQLNYMKEYRKKHPIANPKGFFRSALQKNYTPSKFISEKIKADKRAELSHQKTRNLVAEMEAAKANMNYEAGAMALKNIMDMLDNRG